MSEPERNHSDAVRVVRDGSGGFRYFRARGDRREFTYARPYILELEITRRCNLRCSHCYARATRSAPEGELSFEEIRALLVDARSIGMEELSLTGGEATLHERFVDLLDLGSSLGFGVRFVTNGTLLSPDLVQEIRVRPVRLVTVSLDAMTPEVHEQIRGPGSHAPALEGIERLRAAGVLVSIITAVGKANLGEIEAIRAFCAERNLPWQVQMVSAKGRCPEDVVLSPDEYYSLGELCAGIIAAGEQILVPMDDLAGYSRFQPLSRLSRTWQKRCSGGILNVFVRANGDVTPCSALTFEDSVVGNVRTTPLSRICAEERCRENLAWLSLDRLEGSCAGCPHRAVCFGGCPDILIANCKSRHENEYCYYRIEERRLLRGLLDGIE